MFLVFCELHVALWGGGRRRHRPVSPSDRRVSTGYSSGQGLCRDFSGNCCFRRQSRASLPGTRAPRQKSVRSGLGKNLGLDIVNTDSESSLFFLLLRTESFLSRDSVFSLLGKVSGFQTHSIAGQQVGSSCPLPPSRQNFRGKGLAKERSLYPKASQFWNNSFPHELVT